MSKKLKIKIKDKILIALYKHLTFVSIHTPKCHHILLYHNKKNILSIIQFYFTILQHSNFYFTIQHIKIIFLHNKIIYPKVGERKRWNYLIKSKRERERERERIK